MTARPRKQSESPEAYRRDLLKQVFASGETHACHTQERYQINDHDSLIKAILEVNGSLFCRYIVDQHINIDDYDHQKMFAKIYTDMINAMLIDFIECCEKGERG